MGLPSLREVSRAHRSLLATATTLLLLGGLGAASVRAQVASPVRVGDASVRARTIAVIPRVASAGTRVTVRARSLPALTPVNLAIGGVRSGFESLEFLLTDKEGGLQASVEVPAWAQSDRVHRFIVFDAYFRRLAASDLLTVTDESGGATRAGTIVRRDAECAVLVTTEEERYTVVGNLAGLVSGVETTVAGRVVEGAPCDPGDAERPPLVLIRHVGQR